MKNNKIIKYNGYEKISTLSEKNDRCVSVIQNGETGDVYIQRQLPLNYDISIYERLMEHPIPYIPRIYDVFSHEEQTYVIEEYICGMSLSNKILLGDYSSEFVIQSTLAICSILKELHAMEPPIIHRDIKPLNIIVTDNDELYLVDFDISRQYKKEHDSDTVFMGTRQYASPEQFGFAQTDARSDIYSLGMLMSALLENDAITTTNQAKLDRRDREIQRIIRKCVQVDPKRRIKPLKNWKRICAFFCDTHGKKYS